MKIDRALRESARRKQAQSYEAVESPVMGESIYPVCTHRESNKTLSRSGVVARNTKNIGASAIQKAKDEINRIPDQKILGPKSDRDTGRGWFEANKESIERNFGKLKLDHNHIR